MRRLLRNLSALLLALMLLPGMAWAQAPARLSYLFSDGNIPGTLTAFQTLMQERPDLKGKVELRFLTESTMAEVDPAKLRASNVLVFDMMNEQMLGRWNADHKADLLGEIAKRGTVLAVGQGLLPEDTYRKQGAVFDARAQAYFAHAGPANQLALMKLALERAGIAKFALPAPESSLDFGYYYPDGKSGQVFAKFEDFQAWKAAHGKARPGAPRVAIGFFKSTYYSGDTALLDALIREVERQGGEAVPIFGYPGAIASEQLLLDPAGARRADVQLGLNFQFADPRASKALERVSIPVINLISLYGRSEKEWRSSNTGLSSFEGTFNLAVPELAGTVAPTVVGAKEKVRDPATGLTAVITSPIPERVRMAVSRALKYAALRRTPNAEKRIALIYYNYPPGKANVSASYLNVAELLANVLTRLKAEGYDIGGAAPSADEVLTEITTKGRNVMGAAPGELAEMIAAGAAQRVPMADYRRWLDAMAPALKAKVLKDWGRPEDAKVMVTQEAGGPAFVLPGVRYGKVLLMPQPSRAWGEDLEKMYHAKDLAPHHQYVAAYAWLRSGFKADAVVHVGTHGTLEWLDGKDAGLGPEDAPDALIADLPDAYIYNVDVVGEGLVARRRGQATLIDHMVPPFKPGGLTEELAKLGELMNDQEQNESKNPELAARFGDQLRAQATKMGIAKDLGLDPTQAWSDADLHRIESYLLELKDQKIPYGLHAFGRTPPPDALESTVQAIVSVDRSKLPSQLKVLADDMRQRIQSSGPRELDSLMTVLGGRFVPAGSGGEPIRNPDAYATGNNFYGIDPDKVPKPAAWEMGAKLAEDMLQAHLKRTGHYPQTVSFVIWGDETMRHEGVLESQIFYLLGTKPVWDARGKLVGVEVIPREKLGRPRVDIVIASAAEGMFNNVTVKMDEAVQATKALDEADNAVRQHYLATKAALIAKGVKPEEADKMAGVRIFDEPPGQFNLNTSTIVANSGSWDTDAGFANDYIRKLGHGYGNGYWGQAMPDVFRMNLARVETVVHSSSTALYGALDNDDMFMYMGGLAAAVRSANGGQQPDMLITDTRDPGKPAMASLDKFIGREFRSRYVNPTWIQGMQKEGYAGAGAMREFVEYMWGWKATVPTSVDDAMWQETFETYVQDKRNLGMKAFFESKSPYAYQDITARMIETVRKGGWQTDDATKARLLNEYIESVNAHGVSCTEVSCGNGRLLKYVMDEAAKAGVPAPAVAKARAQLEKAMGRKIETAARTLEAFTRRNEVREHTEQAQAQAAPAPAAPRPQATAPSQAAPAKTARPTIAQVLQGLVMREEDRTPPAVLAPRARPPEPLSPWSIAWPALALLGLLAGVRWRGPFVHGRSAAVIAGLALALGGWAAPQPVSPPGLKAYEVSVAVEGRKAAVAWHGHNGSGRDTIGVSWLDRNGRPRGAATTITDSYRFAYEPDLQLVRGAPLVAWYEKAPTGGALTAWLARLDASGRVAWRARLDAGGGAARNGVVRVVGERIQAAWLEAPAGADPAVWTQAWSLDGRPAGRPRRVGAANRDTWNLNAAADPRGHVLLTYDAAPATGGPHELQLVDVDAPASKVITLTPADGQASVYPAIAVSRGGQAAVTWFDSRDGNEEVYLAVLPLADLLAGAALPAQRLTFTKAASTGAYLAWNGERLAVAWCDAEPGQNELYLQLFDRSGRPQSAARRLTDTPAESYIPSIRAWGSGFLIGWNEYGPGAGLGHAEDPPSVAMTLRVQMKISPIGVDDFTRIYDPSAGQTRGYAWYVNDHSFIRGEDGVWHLFGITQQNPFRPFEEVFFTHVTAPDLFGPWTKQPDVMHRDAGTGESVVWAPHVIRHDGRYWMFYCGGDADPKRFRINLATSDDLFTWTRSPQNPLLQDGYEARDPMVLRVGDEWVLYYTANEAPEGGRHTVAAVTSRDLVHWSDKRTVFTSERSGTGGGPTESPFVVARDGKFLLFVCTNRRYIETAVYESDDPFDWTEAQRIATIPAHAAEIVEMSDGATYISGCGWGMGGVYLARLTFEA